MMLPKINPSRLQKIVADLEFKKTYEDLDRLCADVAETDWAKSFPLDLPIVRALMYKLNTITKVEKPQAQPVVADAGAFTQDTTQDTPSTVATYDEPAKGRKLCPSCKKYVSGLRTKVCPCGHAFATKAETPSKPAPAAATSRLTPVSVEEDNDDTGSTDSEGEGRHFRMKTWVPAGECPVKLKSTDIEEVRVWAKAVRKAFAARHNSFLRLHGLKYWARDFFDPFTPQYETVYAHLNEIYPNDRLAEKDR